MQTFETGATRNNDSDQLDYDGFLSPLVLERYAIYLHSHRKTPLGLRDSDNWQKGIPLAKYIKSMWRHFMEVWQFHRGCYIRKPSGNNLEESLCALLFNVMGYLHEYLKAKTKPLERCDTEIARCESELMKNDDPTGALLGYRDWNAEKKFIENGNG